MTKLNLRSHCELRAVPKNHKTYLTRRKNTTGLRLLNDYSTKLHD